ncbi:MAG: hypothetical protein QXK37_01625 [Candidatus Woesearchaeota archaeon]
MLVTDIVEQVEKSQTYTSWEGRENFYLVHLFYMTGHNWQVGYYNKGTGRIVTFEANGGVKRLEESDVFQDSPLPLSRLNVESVKIDYKDAVEKAKIVAEKHFPHEHIDKEIAVLQETKQGVLYNITFLTRSFKMLNIKIDADKSEVLHYELHSLMDMTRKEDIL